jgi:hypothetical protein
LALITLYRHSKATQPPRETSATEKASAADRFTKQLVTAMDSVPHNQISEATLNEGQQTVNEATPRKAAPIDVGKASGAYNLAATEYDVEPGKAVIDIVKYRLKWYVLDKAATGQSPTSRYIRRLIGRELCKPRKPYVEITDEEAPKWVDFFDSHTPKN